MKIYVVEGITPECHCIPCLFTDPEEAVVLIRSEYEQKIAGFSDVLHQCAYEIDEKEYYGEAFIDLLQEDVSFYWRLSEHEI